MPRVRVGSRGRGGAVLVLAALGGLVAIGLGGALVQRVPGDGTAAIALEAGAAGSGSGSSAGMAVSDVDIVASGTAVSATLGLAQAPLVVRAAVIVGEREIGASEREVMAIGPIGIDVPVSAPPFDVVAELVVTAWPDRDSDSQGRGEILVRRTFLLRAPAGAGLLGLERLDGPSGTAVVVHAFVPPSSARVNVHLEDERGVVLGSAAGSPASATLWGGLLVGTAPVSVTVLVGEIVPGSVVALVLAWDDANGRQTMRRLLVVPEEAMRPDASSDRP